MFSTENALLAVVILEFILAAYAVVIGIIAKHKVVKILNIAFGAFWVVMAIINIVNGLAV